jgi:hypothetical protein
MLLGIAGTGLPFTEDKYRNFAGDLCEIRLKNGEFPNNKIRYMIERSIKGETISARHIQFFSRLDAQNWKWVFEQCKEDQDVLYNLDVPIAWVKQRRIEIESK